VDVAAAPGGGVVGEAGSVGRERIEAVAAHRSICSAAMNASWGTSTCPTIFIRFLPSFWRSRSFRFRVTSPP
jgi:hypothetical protein